MSLPLISIVVPTLNEAATITSALAALVPQGTLEVVVADGGSNDGTPRLAAAAGARVVSAAPGRASQMNAGAAVARGEVLLFLHADTRLPGGAADLVLAALERPEVVGGCFRLRFDRAGLLLSLSAWCSRFESYWTTFGDQAYFVRRSTFDDLGGFPVQPLMEDVAFRRLLRMRGRFMKLPATVTTSARRFERRGPLRQQLLNARLLAAYALGVSPHRLARYYR